MTGVGGPMFSRTEVLGGMPARRAASAMFTIENRTARLVVRSRRAVERYVSERAAAHQEQAFLQALAEGREPPLRPSIQDIERHAPDWANLVPPDPSLRATIAHQLGAKYRFTRDRAPGIRAALGIDDPQVADAHVRHFSEPIHAIYADRLSSRERWRWRRSSFAERLESLPPVWAAFALTLTETVGAGVLALPIALAGIGVIPAIALLVVFGLINLATIAALVESINRDGAIRYGTAYFGRLVEDYLGIPGRVVLSATLFIINALAVISYVIGFALTLAAVTSVPWIVWVALLLVATIGVLQRGSLDATVATAIAVGCVNIALLVAIALVGLAHADVALLTALPARLEVGSLALVFGVLLTAFFGHTSAATAAKVVLARDPSGRALLRGNVAAIALAIVLYAFVVIGVNGAVRPAEMLGFAGTSIEPLARVSGPLVSLFGAAFVVLAMGLATVTCSLALYNQAREALPDRWFSAGPALHWKNARLMSSTPVVLAFGAVPVMMALGGGSFSGPIALLGTVATPILGGVFPMLMLLAARRRGEFVPADAPRGLGHPAIVAAIAGLFTAGIVVQGSVIWQDLPSRLLAGGAVIVILAMCFRTWQAGAFRPRAVLRLAADSRGDRLTYRLVNGGHAVPTSVRIVEGDSERLETEATASLASRDLRSATFIVPGGEELHVWAHRVTDEGDSIPLNFVVSLGDEAPELGSALVDGRLTVALPPEAKQITIYAPAIDRVSMRQAPTALPSLIPVGSPLVVGREVSS
jgi:amino acid permease